MLTHCDDTYCIFAIFLLNLESEVPQCLTCLLFWIHADLFPSVSFRVPLLLHLCVSGRLPSGLYPIPPEVSGGTGLSVKQSSGRERWDSDQVTAQNLNESKLRKRSERDGFKVKTEMSQRGGLYLFSSNDSQETFVWCWTRRAASCPPCVESRVKNTPWG